MMTIANGYNPVGTVPARWTGLNMTHTSNGHRFGSRAANVGFVFAAYTH